MVSMTVLSRTDEEEEEKKKGVFSALVHRGGELSLQQECRVRTSE